jgi:hypothetical protein
MKKKEIWKLLEKEKREIWIPRWINLSKEKKKDKELYNVIYDFYSKIVDVNIELKMKVKELEEEVKHYKAILDYK